MTRPLYHQPDLHFSSPVTAVQGQEVALEASAFYPQGGGQGSDRGTLGTPERSWTVQQVRRDKQTGLIWHALDGGPLPCPGEVLHGEVDPQTRWRHSQRHSAEHLLAQAFERIDPSLGVAAVSMLSAECSIDLLGDPSPAQIEAAEALLRETLGREPLALQTPVVDEAELGRYPLRRAAKVSGQVRLVIFADAGGQPFDVSACGGTHVPWAAMCGPVVILRSERIKGGLTRLTFRAGEEASAYLAELHQQARKQAQGFSLPVDGLWPRLEQLKRELGQAKTDQEQLRQRLAQALVQGWPLREPGHWRGGTVPEAALLLPALQSVRPGELLAVVSPCGRCGISSQQPQHHAGTLLRRALTELGGKGGGQAELAQGQTSDPQGFLAVLERLIEL